MLHCSSKCSLNRIQICVQSIQMSKNCLTNSASINAPGIAFPAACCTSKLTSRQQSL